MSRGLTVKGVEALRFDRDGHRVADRDGLYVRLSPAGGKSFQLRATVGQERPWITLGTCEELTLAAARKLGAKVRDLLREGVSLARIRVALKGSRSARTLEAHLPAEGGLGRVLPDEGVAEIASVSSGSAPAHRRSPSASSASALVVPLSDLRWDGGARGRGWVRISTDEAVDFSRTRAAPAGRHGSGKAHAAASEHARPFEGLMPTSTVHEAVVAWFEAKRLGLRNGKHVDQNWNTMAAYVLPALGDLALAEVRRKHVSNLLWPIWREKHETARRVQGRLREVFELAVAEELREDNPAAFDPKVALGRVRKSTKHHGSLPPSEVREFWDWLLTTPCSEKTRGFVQLILLTARRTGEGRFAVWSDFDLGELSWDELAQSMGSLQPGEPVPLVIWDTPEARMKMARVYRTPLSRQAVQVLLNLRRLAPTGVSGKAYIFASKTRSGTLSENTGLKHVQTYREDITVHGLRSTFRTWGSEARWDKDLLEFALAHVQGKLEAAYQRSDLLEQRRPLMQAWADVVTRGRDVPEPGQVMLQDVSRDEGERELDAVA